MLMDSYGCHATAVEDQKTFSVSYTEKCTCNLDYSFSTPPRQQSNVRCMFTSNSYSLVVLYSQSNQPRLVVEH